jgi:hypothetical protein
LPSRRLALSLIIWIAKNSAQMMARSTSRLLLPAAAATLLVLSSDAFFFSRMPVRLQLVSKSPQLALFG